VGVVPVVVDVDCARSGLPTSSSAAAPNTSVGVFTSAYGLLRMSRASCFWVERGEL